MSIISPSRRRARAPSRPAVPAAPLGAGVADFWIEALCAMRPPALPAHQAEIVDGHPAAGPEDHHDDGEPDGHLGGGHRHHEEDHALPVDATESVTEGHEREVRGVEHELDRHEDD